MLADLMQTDSPEGGTTSSAPDFGQFQSPFHAGGVKEGSQGLSLRNPWLHCETRLHPGGMRDFENTATVRCLASLRDANIN